MNNYRSHGGPLNERPFYKLGDVEQMCVTELRRVGLFPSEPSAVRVERFIEKRWGHVIRYEELPNEVLGYSQFGRNGLQAIVVSRALVDDDSKVAARRVTTTLAHEVGHALLHGHLFALGAPEKSLFGGEVTTPKILCRDVRGMESRSAQVRYNGQWWEFQANLMIGCLLLPRSLVHKTVKQLLKTVGLLGVTELLPESQRNQAITLVSDIFDVNPIVARFRLQELFPEKNMDQLSL